MSKPLFPRDQASETALLVNLQTLNYALLQHDWDSEKHGDLDIVLDRKDWGQFLDILLAFSKKNSFPVVKAYEIEHGLVCFVLLTREGALFLDVAIAGARAESFGVTLHHALAKRQRIHVAFVVDKTDEQTYAQGKLAVKRSVLHRVFNKVRNLPVIVRRVYSCTLLCRGCLLYIPYLTQEDLLRTSAVVQKTATYIESTLRKRYTP